MANENKEKSFRNRRKLIEEMAPQRKADALASSQNDELGNISSQLKDAQAASEMTADAIEQKGNEVISSLGEIGKKIEDTNAGIEIASEAVERVGRNTQQISGASRAISAKIEKLSNMLNDKLTADIKKSPTTQESTTLAALQEAMPLQVEQPNLTELLEKLIPQHPIPEDAPFLPGPTEPTEEKKEKKDNFKFDFAPKFDELISTSKGGFKSVVSVTDKIAGMLFKYTVSALANSAKLAAQLFSVVLGIDIIRVYFQYFMKQFEASWAGFSDKFKEWGPLLEGLMTFAKNAQKMFSEGNWMKLAEAIIKGMLSLTENMANLLMLGIGKLTAAMLRSMGFNDAAANVEGSALQTFQQKTGATLDEEDSTTLAKYQDRKDAEKFEGKKKAYDRFKGNDQALEFAVKNGSVSQETADEIRNGGVEASFRNLPEEQRLEVFKKRNQAQADITRLTKTAENTMSPDQTDIKNAAEMRGKIEAQLQDPSLKNAPKDLNMEQLIEKLDTTLNKFDMSTLKPQDVSQSEDVQKAVKVNEMSKAREASQSGTGAGAAAGNLFQQVNVKKTSKTQYNMPPQSSTPAPGMHNAVRVN